MPSFVIPGRPYSKKRPRFARATGRAYDPAENAKAEAAIGHIASRLFNGPITGPVHVEIEARFMPAASWSKKRRAEALGQSHAQKPDCDNIAKAVLDGLNRIAWADDAQVAAISIRKVWAERDEVLVTVRGAE